MKTFATAEEFEAWYAGHSGMTVGQWRALAPHRYPAPCDCDEDLCTGWQMAHREDGDAAVAQPGRASAS